MHNINTRDKDFTWEGATKGKEGKVSTNYWNRLNNRMGNSYTSTREQVIWK